MRANRQLPPLRFVLPHGLSVAAKFPRLEQMGLFLTLEGIDGAGKSTQIDLLQKFLESKGRSVVVAREPGGTETGEQIRRMLLEGDDLAPWTEASLFAAARAELVARVVRPALQWGQDVILDRYLDSSLAYQGFGRGLPIDPLLEWNMLVTEGLLPDRTFLLALPAEDATARVIGQLQLFPMAGGLSPPDRMEREAFWFRRDVDDGFRELARRYPERIVHVDASKSRKTIAGTIRSHVTRLLKRDAPQKVSSTLLACS